MKHKKNHHHGVELEVNGKKYSGWTKVAIIRGIEQICGSFELTYTTKWQGQDKAWPINCGDACTLYLNDNRIITGHVDEVVTKYDAHTFSIMCTGRDAASDLVDCSVASVPRSWTNQTVDKIAIAICDPFKIPVKCNADVGLPLKESSAHEGETAFAAIERMCRYRGILPVSDGHGGLVLTGPGKNRVSKKLKGGVNILAATGTKSWKDRYKTYMVKGSNCGLDAASPDMNAGPHGDATDKYITRYRPLTIIAENPGDIEAMKKRAIWEASVRYGRSDRAKILVWGWGWNDENKKNIWHPNWMVNIDSPMLNIKGDRLIVSVTQIRDEQGTRTELEVCRKEGMVPAVLPEEMGLPA